jgi:hypothetical protein
MLSPSEFTVGTFGSAAPLSLVLPRTRHEETVLIGHIDGAPTAVFLSGQFASHFFQSTGNHRWRGLIIPDVRIEVDETSLFDPDQNGAPLSSVIRTDTRLVIRAKAEHALGQSTVITLHDELTSAGELRAGFTRWQVVIGGEQTKRVLWRTSDEDGSA